MEGCFNIYYLTLKYLQYLTLKKINGDLGFNEEFLLQTEGNCCGIALRCFITPMTNGADPLVTYMDSFRCKHSNTPEKLPCFEEEQVPNIAEWNSVSEQ